MLMHFAGKHDLIINWISGSEQMLMKRLEKRELHFVISGFTNHTPWKKRKAGFTRAYYEKDKGKHVIALKQGENKLLFEFEIPSWK